MGELVFVRHGQASFGADDYDKLSETGHTQSRWLGAYFDAHGLAFDHVVSGDLRRHRETAAGIAAATRLPEATIDSRLNEFPYDPLQEEYLGKTGIAAPRDRSAFLRLFPEIYFEWETGVLTSPPETFEAFHSRVAAATDAALRPGQNTLVVTSGGVIGSVVRRVLGLDARAAANLLLNIHNASVHRFVFEEGGLRLSVFNASPHLDPADRVHARTYI